VLCGAINVLMEVNESMLRAPLVGLRVELKRGWPSWNRKGGQEQNGEQSGRR